MRPDQWVRDGLRLLAIIVVVFAGWWLFTTGKGVATAEWTAKYETLKADYARRRQEELDRQESASREAKRLEAERIAALVEQNRQLEETVEDLLHEASIDPDADRVCLSSDSRLRINKVR